MPLERVLGHNRNNRLNNHRQTKKRYTNFHLAFCIELHQVFLSPHLTISPILNIRIPLGEYRHVRFDRIHALDVR